jgi:uncharacterized protein YggU (UPF0235/DUF167 family)
MALHPLVIDIDVVRDQGNNGWTVEPSGRFRVHHKEPESRDANEFLIKTLAEKLHVPHSHITIVHGVEERVKRVKIGKDITKEELIVVLDAKEFRK